MQEKVGICPFKRFYSLFCVILDQNAKHFKKRKVTHYFVHKTQNMVVRFSRPFINTYTFSCQFIS